MTSRKHPRLNYTLAFACLATLLFATSQTAAEQRLQAEPEATTGHTEKSLSTAKKYMISVANPHAANAGLEILRRGGSAVDAAIAAQLVLGLVEPQSSGLGGGALVLHWNAKTQALNAYDGRETAPVNAKPDRFLKEGKRLPFRDAVKSGLSVGTPGLVRLLEHLHKKHGKVPWKDLFQPAIRLARDGFDVTTRLHLMLQWFGKSSFSPEARDYFFDANGSPWGIGHTLKNAAYAETLKQIAKEGADAFYKGPIADAIVRAVTSVPDRPGDLTLNDLATYQVKERKPLCVPYKGRTICGFPPPSSGGVAIAQIMKLIEPLDIGVGTDGTPTTAALHTIIEAQKLAYADRNRYLADPDFVKVPVLGLLDKTYLQERRSLIKMDSILPKVQPGTPPGLKKQAFGRDATQENVGTSHISVIDGSGNAIAWTTTIEGAFGSGLFSNGFLLNNELTDFSFKPTDQDGRPIANRVQPGKRPRSTMSPTIVLNADGTPYIAIGSPGGSRIILYVVKALIGMLDWNLNAQQAIDLPNFGTTGKGVQVETAFGSVWNGINLLAKGHTVTPDLMNSGLHAVVRRKDHLEGAADPRREGVAVGD